VFELPTGRDNDLLDLRALGSERDLQAHRAAVLPRPVS
jgi:hypothetical protein